MELCNVILAKDYVNIRLISIKVSSAKTEGQFKSLGILPQFFLAEAWKLNNLCDMLKLHTWGLCQQTLALLQ